MAGAAGPALAAPAAPPPGAGRAITTGPSAPAGGRSLASRGVLVSASSPKLPPGLASRGWLLTDLDTGAVLAARDPHGRYLPASTIKILTALAVLPLLPPRKQVAISEDAVNVDGTKTGLAVRARYRIDLLATAMLIASGNDAATALSDAAGGRARTVALMNATARRLGTTDTVAGDPAGLDAAGQVTSPFDLALLGRAALADPRVSRYLTISKAAVPVPLHTPFQIQNHNRLLGTYPGCIGVKNGYTNAAQATYVGAARRNGHTLLVTLLHSPPVYAKDARALLDWGFRNLARIAPVGNLDTRPAAGEVIGPAARASQGVWAVGPHRVGVPTGGGGAAADAATVAVVVGGAAAAGALVGSAVYLGRRRRWRRRTYGGRPYLR